MSEFLPVRLRTLWFSFWALPLIYIVGAALLFLAMSAIDNAGASIWLGAQRWPLSVSGDTALEAISSLVTILVSLVALFFSITLIVLTMAASNLGVRLIDRWVGDISIRVTLSLLLGLLTYALLLQAAIDPAGPDARLPRLSLLMLVGALLPSLAWLAKAFDHLSRRIHIDTSIDDLVTDLEQNLAGLAALSAPGRNEPDWQAGMTITSPRAGYVDGVDIKGLLDLAHDHDLLLHMPYAQGDYVHEGDVILHVKGNPDRTDEKLLRKIDISRWRSDDAGAMFQAALLAEIAARALSPAVNDIYTALDCIDHLGGGLGKAFADQHSGGWFGGPGEGARLFVPDLTPRGVLRRPLDIIRQAAAPYPSASIRLIDMLGRLIGKATNADDRDWLSGRVRLVARSALQESPVEADRDDIRQALRNALGQKPLNS
ncbi:MAG: DUF2254 family protein [Pacificimonas sp.]